MLVQCTHPSGSCTWRIKISARVHYFVFTRKRVSTQLLIYKIYKNAQFCHFLREESVFFFHFFNFVKNGPFSHIWKVDFKLWDKHKYTMSTHYVLWYSKLFLFKNAPFCHFVRGSCIFSLLLFCQKCSILSFSERPVDFFASSILSFCERTVDFFRFFNFVKMLNFVILGEDREFVHFFNFVKNAQFCHFLRGPGIFFTFQYCQKWPILSFLKSGLQIMR